MVVFQSFRLDSEQSDAPAQQRRRRFDDPPRVEYPHICTTTGDGNDSHITKCYVYTKDLKFLPIEATMHSATNQENETSSAEWCRYPIGKMQIIYCSLLYGL